MARERIETDLIVRAITEGFGQVSKDFGKMRKSEEQVEKQTSKLSGAIKKLGSGLTTIAGGIAGFSIAIKKAFDFGESLANIKQTEESFGFFIDKIGLAPDILNQLRSAAKGTISDIGLMESTMLLLAGAGDELAQQMGNATPQLLEIAKAANKLNPSLGDTAFLYDSISRGIKRSSPRILDNLGIVIKVGEANQSWADKMGIAVSAMSAENKQLALLNAVLRSGRNLIDQVGGSTDAAADSFLRLKAEVANLKQELADVQIFGRSFVQFLTDAATAATLLMTWNKKISAALEEQEANLLATSLTYEDYVEGIKSANKSSGDLFLTQLELNEVLGVNAGATETVKNVTIIMSEAQFKAARSAEVMADKVRSSKEALQGLTQAAGEVAEIVPKTAEEVAEAIDEIKEAAAKAREESNALWDDLNVGIEKTIDNWITKIDFMEAGGLELVLAIDAISERMKEGLLPPTEARKEFENLKLDAAAIQVAIGERTGWEAARMLAADVGGEISEWKRKLDEMDGIRLSVVLDVIAKFTGVQQFRGVFGDLVPRAHGGKLVPGRWHLIGEMGAELVSPEGQVIDARKTRKILETGFLPDSRFGVVIGGGGGQDPLPPVKDPKLGTVGPKTETPTGNILTGTGAVVGGQVTGQVKPVIPLSVITQSAEIAAVAASAVAGSAGVQVAQQVNQSVKKQILQGQALENILEEIRELLEEQPEEIGVSVAVNLESSGVGG